MNPAKMPLSAVGMIAAHLFLERIKVEDVLPRDLQRVCYGKTLPGGKKITYGDLYAHEAAVAAWTIADAVEEVSREREETLDRTATL